MFKVQGSKVIVLRSLFSVYSLHCTAIQNSAFKILILILDSNSLAGLYLELYSLRYTAIIFQKYIQNSAFKIQNFNPDSWFLRLVSDFSTF